MPTITEKKYLGNLYGGNIASINYSFQSGSEASSCTLTVISESNSFIKPKLNERIVIPIFRFPMDVIEHRKIKNERHSTLQIELIDASAKILDNELVLIYGEHTDSNYKLDNDLYFVYNSFYIPREAFPTNSLFNGSVTFPNVTKRYLKSHGDGINVIGFPRATFVDEVSVNITGPNSEQKDPSWINFDAKIKNEDLSSYPGNFLFSQEKAGNLNITYGYTLRNLYDLIISKKLRFKQGTESLMFDENIIFNESGTIRNVLSSCLSKLGRSFYIHPVTQEIVIVTNADIAKINANIISEFSNFEDVAGATQISLTESLRDVVSEHFVVKGDLDYANDSDDNQPQNESRLRKQVFYKLDAEALTNDIDENEFGIIKRVAPLLYEIQDEETIDTYLFALSFVYPNEEWGNLYGQNDFEVSEHFGKVYTENHAQVFANPATKPQWQNILEQSSFGSFVFFDKKKAIGGRHITRDELDAETNTTVKVPGRKGSEAGYYDTVKDFLSLWYGIYFSREMTKKEVESRQYQTQARWMKGQDNSFTFIIADGEAYIGEVPELQFLFRLLKRIGAKTNYKVKEIARKALNRSGNGSAPADPDGNTPLGEGRYYAIALRNMFAGSSFEEEDMNRLIRENFLMFDDAGSQNTPRIVVYTEQALEVVRAVEKASLDSFEEEIKKVKSKLIARFSVSKPDEDPDSEYNGDEIHEVPEALFLRNVRSRINNFSSRSLNIIRNRISEIKLFLERINEINPEFEGPFLSTEIEYFRPPLQSDFDVDKGVDSISVSISESGITTSVKYSSRKFAQIDTAILQDMLGANTVEFIKSKPTNAVLKVLRRE